MQDNYENDHLNKLKEQAEIEMGVPFQDENTINMEIAFNQIKKYKNKTTCAYLNEDYQLLNIWFWKWSLSDTFYSKIKISSWAPVINSYMDVNISNKTMGKLVNFNQLRKITKQSGAYGRPLIWNWQCAGDLSASMWLFGKIWIFNENLIKRNNGNSIAPVDNQTREGIEADLRDMDYRRCLEAYVYDRRNVAKEVEQW